MSLLDAHQDLFLKTLLVEHEIMERLDPESRESEVDIGYEDLDQKEIEERAEERKKEIFKIINKKKKELLVGFKGGTKARKSVEDVLDGMTNEEILLMSPQISAINRMLSMFNQLPSVDDMTATALAGVAKRGWYRDAASAINEVFGADAPRFVALLAASSPNVTVSDNLRHATRMWEVWNSSGRPRKREDIENAFKTVAEERIGSLKAFFDRWVEEGKPTNKEKYQELAKEVIGDSPEYYAAMNIFERKSSPSENAINQFLKTQSSGDTYFMLRKEAWGDNVMRALTHPNPVEMGQDIQTKLTIKNPDGDKEIIPVDRIAHGRLSGDKVESFRKNLLGDLSSVTNDTWMAQYGDIYQQMFSRKQNYATMSSLARRTARRLNQVEGIDPASDEAWTPAEVQETVWSLFKAMTENVVRRGEKWPEDIYSHAEDRAAELTDEDIAGVDDFASSIASDKEIMNALERLGIPRERIEFIRNKAESAKARFETGEEASSPWERLKKASLAGVRSEVVRRSASIKLRKKTDKLLDNPAIIISKVKIRGLRVEADMTNPSEAHNMRAFLIALFEGLQQGKDIKGYNILVSPFKNQYYIVQKPRMKKRDTKAAQRQREKAGGGEFVPEELQNFINVEPADALQRPGPFKVTFIQKQPPLRFDPHPESIKRYIEEGHKNKKSVRKMFKLAMGATSDTNQFLDKMVKERPEDFAGIQPSTIEMIRRKKMTYGDQYDVDRDWMERHEADSYEEWKNRMQSSMDKTVTDDDKDKDEDEDEILEEPIDESISGIVGSVFFNGEIILS